MRFSTDEKPKKVSNMTVKRRRIIRIGGTFYVSLPKAFIAKHGLERGSEVAVVANDRVQIVVP